MIFKLENYTIDKCSLEGEIELEGLGRGDYSAKNKTPI